MITPNKRNKFFTLLYSVRKQIGFFGDNSTLHGVRHVISISHIQFLKRMFWLLILSASAVCAAAVLLPILSLYSQDQVSFYVDTNYLDFNTPFPAVTLCELANETAAQSYIEQHKLPIKLTPFLRDVSYWNVNLCKPCSNCKNDTCMTDFGAAVDHVRSKCGEVLTDCWWGGKHFPCCERFLPIHTEYGACFVFNSRLTGNQTTYTVNRVIGLPLLEFTAIRDVGIRIHSPDDIVSVGMENIFGRRSVQVPMITDLEVILSAEQTVSDKSVSAMPFAARGCLYSDERPEFATLWPFRRYSPNTCNLYCRARAQTNLCNCTHHLMPSIRDIPPCNIQGLACLYKKKDSLGSATCECPMSCDEINYKLVHMFAYRHTSNIPPEIAARGTRGVVRIGQLPVNRIRRSAIRTPVGLVVDIGGVGGVFFGASLLNVIEIIYLICIRRRTEAGL